MVKGLRVFAPLYDRFLIILFLFFAPLWHDSDMYRLSLLMNAHALCAIVVDITAAILCFLYAYSCAITPIRAALNKTISCFCCRAVGSRLDVPTI